MRQRIVVLVHGIHSGPVKSEWEPELGARIVARNPGLIALPFQYGYVLGVAIRLPWIGGLVRAHLRRRLQRFLRKILSIHGADAEISAVAHSFGTWLVHHSMLEGHPRMFYDRLVYMGGIVSSREDFSSTAMLWHFQHLLNLYSQGDEVVRLAPFGHCGHVGFQNADGVRVQNMDLTPYNHRDYTSPGKAWDAVVDFIGGEP